MKDYAILILSFILLPLTTASVFAKNYTYKCDVLNISTMVLDNIDSSEEHFIRSNLQKKFTITIFDNYIATRVFTENTKYTTKYKIIKRKGSEISAINTDETGYNVLAISTFFYKGYYNATLSIGSFAGGTVWKLGCARF